MKVCEVIISIGPATTKMTADIFDDLKEAAQTIIDGRRSTEV